MMEQTDRRTPHCYVDPAPQVMRSAYDYIYRANDALYERAPLYRLTHFSNAFERQTVYAIRSFYTVL